MKMRRLLAAAACAALLVSSALAQTQSGVGPTPPANSPPPYAPLGGCVYMPGGVALSGFVGPMGLTCGANGGLNVNVLSGGGSGGAANPYPASDYAKDGTDGSGITPPTGGGGIRGWLSGIYKAVTGQLSTADVNAAQTITAPGTAPVKAQGVQGSDGTALEKDATGQAIKSALGAVGQGAPGGSPWPVTESAGNLATSQATATATSGQLCAARVGRRAVTLENLGATAVYYGASGVSTTTGALLPGGAGSAVTLNTAAAVYGITASGSQAVACVETY